MTEQFQKAEPRMKITTKELTPALWPELEKLFGPNGACGGCWCMHWRLERGEDWAKIKGAEAKKRLRELVRSGKARGILAFADGEPVGWAAHNRRTELPKLNRSPSLKCDDAESVWSVPCFYIKARYRGQGVATALLAATIKALKKAGAEKVEGYPVKVGKEKIPAAFAWTGTPSLFEKQGFKQVGAKASGKQRMRREL